MRPDTRYGWMLEGSTRFYEETQAIIAENKNRMRVVIEALIKADPVTWEYWYDLHVPEFHWGITIEVKRVIEIIQAHVESLVAHERPATAGSVEAGKLP